MNDQATTSSESPAASRRAARALAFAGVALLAMTACTGGQPTMPGTTPASPAPSMQVPPSQTATSLGALEDSVAYIETTGTFVTADGAEEQTYTGTGFVIDPSGLIVTNNHVVTGGAFWKVSIGKDQTLLDARLIGASECSDLAVLKVEGTFPALKLSSAAPRVGDAIFVAGHPNGDPYTLTDGIVAKPPSASDTSWASVKQQFQITAQTFPGNSGSPVVNAAGEVVGIEYAGGTAGSAIAGKSFAISSAEALPIIAQLGQGATLDSIGINGEANRAHTGIAILSVAPGSPASNAGLKAGDLLTNLNGTAVGTDGTKETYCSVLRSHKAVDVLSVAIERNGRHYSGELNGRAIAAAEAPTTPGIDSLLAVISPRLAPSCKPYTQGLPAGAIAGLECPPAAGAGASDVWFDLYPSAAAARAQYRTDSKAVHAKVSAFGSCTKGTKDIEYTTTFGDGAKLEGPNYRLLCFKNSHGAWLEQEDPAVSVIVTMVRDDGNQKTLHNWWAKNVTTVDPHP